MSLYKEYLEEIHNGKSTVEDDKGFASYWIRGEECYIEDIYVKKEFRKENIASSYADRITAIAVENGCKYLSGSVVPNANNATKSLKVLLGYGFKVHSSQNNFILFIKELGNE